MRHKHPTRWHGRRANRCAGERAPVLQTVADVGNGKLSPSAAARRWSMSARCRHSRHHTTSCTFAAAALPSNIAGPLVGVLHRPDAICTKHRIRWGCVSA
jgi:hypothetical protein